MVHSGKAMISLLHLVPNALLSVLLEVLHYYLKCGAMIHQWLRGIRRHLSVVALQEF